MGQFDHLKPPILANQGMLPWAQEMLDWAGKRFTDVEDVLSGDPDSPLGKLATPPPALPKRPSIAWFRSLASWLSDRISDLREIFAAKSDAP